MKEGKKMANEIKSFQGYVNQSLMDAGKHKTEDYLEIMTGLFEQGHLNIHQVFLFMQTLIIKADDKKVRTYLELNPTIDSNVQDTMDYGLVTEDGELTQHCIDTLTKEGFADFIEKKEVVKHG
jgi:hypothetical protein|tara:strand:+ start:402 stop:770 length:369 start_codon:yes stop_codon:yes gene_type:complete